MLFPVPIELLACNLFSCLWDKKKVAVKRAQAWQQLVKDSSTRRPFMTFKASDRGGKEKHILICHSHNRCDHSDFTYCSIAWTCTRPKLLAVLWNECVHNWHFEDTLGKVHLGYIHKADSAWYWPLQGFSDPWVHHQSKISSAALEQMQEEQRIWLKTGSNLTQLLCNSSLVVSDCSKESW